MKDVKKEVQAVTKEIKGIQKKTKQLKTRLDKIEKAVAAAKTKSTKVKTTKKAPAQKKPVAKKTTAKQGAKLTATDQVVNLIEGSTDGVDVPTLAKKTGLADKTLRNILFRAGKLGKIKRSGRGVYVGA
jgi:cell division septum initiation protein DivIVA